MLWKIKFVIDNGYEQTNHICIVSADGKLEAKLAFVEWINSVLRGEEFVVANKTEMEFIYYDNGIVYQNVTK